MVCPSLLRCFLPSFADYQNNLTMLKLNVLQTHIWFTTPAHEYATSWLLSCMSDRQTTRAVSAESLAFRRTGRTSRRPAGTIWRLSTNTRVKKVRKAGKASAYRPVFKGVYYFFLLNIPKLFRIVLSIASTWYSWFSFQFCLLPPKVWVSLQMLYFGFIKHSELHCR